MTVDLAAREALGVSVGAFVDELVRSGVRHFCVCPGSRSTPLALTIARHPAARLWMHLDERSAAFFGLGLAKVRREPVALVCTSGTAAANFLPAVVEAYYGRVPLVVVTADRPHELRDCGAPQTIDQVHLFGLHAKWFCDLAEPELTADLVRHVRIVANRAVATARRGPAGPVHVNWPYREPLVPIPMAGMPLGSDRVERPLVTVASGPRTALPEQVTALADELVAARRGLIVCGPQDDPALAASLVELARAVGYPILADPLSLVRCGRHDRRLVMDRYDAFLRDPDLLEQLAPEVVIRFGAMPTSKPVLLSIERWASQRAGSGRPSRHVIVDGDGGWNEPTGLATDVVHVDGRTLCEALVGALPAATAPEAERADWVAAWRRANERAGSAIARRLASMDDLFEGKVFVELADLLPDGTVLYAGNSMPVRDLDTFFPGSDRSIRFLANRGANGIDGVVSSALGAVAGGSAPVVLVIGDLSFYHDSNGLLAARQHGLNATIVLLNNDGGGIFSFLPQASEAEHFETLFGTPHGLDFRPIAEAYGATFSRVAAWDGFRKTVRRGLTDGGLAVVEVATDRGRNVALHREVWQAVAEGLQHG